MICFLFPKVSLNGVLEFSDPPEHYTYPLVFPIKDWPRRNDPSFIGIFFSKCRIGRIYQTDFDQRVPGVYFRYIYYSTFIEFSFVGGEEEIISTRHVQRKCKK